MRKTRTLPNPRKSSVAQERVGALMAEFGYYRSPMEADRSQPIERLAEPQPVLNWPGVEQEKLRLSVASLN
jgi:hypothetical protein